MNLAVSRSADDIFLIVFGGIAAILLTARLLGWLFQKFGLPAVVGEVIGGIVLGPSLLGLLPGDPDELLFPPDMRPYLRIVAQLGLVIYMFIVGLELDTKVLGANRSAAVSISLSSISLTFAGGLLVGLALHDSHDTADKLVGAEIRTVDVDLLPFALFCGLSICGSAFAILARILDERRLFSTRMGPILMGCAVVDDIAVWMLASVVLAVAASEGLSDVPEVLGGLALFVVVLFFVVRPFLARLFARWYRPEQGLSGDVLAALLLGLLASACYTTWLGISPILGSFLFGAAVPRSGFTAIRQQATDQLESISVLVLLPVFFVVTGLGVDLSVIGIEGALTLLLLVVVATSGKLIGAAAAARFQGFRGRRAVAVGCLMNTRGLTELAILALGRDLGVLDTTMFTALVTTAITTTIVAGPLLRAVYPERLIDADIAEEERARLAATDDYRVLVLVDEPDDIAPVVDLASLLASSERSSEVVLSRVGLLQSRGELGSGFMGNLGQMASAMEELARLGDRVSFDGVRVVPLTQFTDDVARDLLAQIDRVRPNLVLLAQRDGADVLAERVAREAKTDVAVVSLDLSLDGPIGVRNCTEANVVAAAEIGVRLARAAGRSMIVGKGRRIGALVEQLIELSASVEEGEPTGLVVSDAADGSPIVVTAGMTDSGWRSFDSVVERLGTSTQV